MGDNYQTIVDLEADLQSASALATRVRDWMVSQQVMVAQETDCVMLGGLGHAPAQITFWRWAKLLIPCRSNSG